MRIVQSPQAAGGAQKGLIGSLQYVRPFRRVAVAPEAELDIEERMDELMDMLMHQMAQMQKRLDTLEHELAIQQDIHAVLGHSEHCIATHPSDMCVALSALEAIVEPDLPATRWVQLVFVLFGGLKLTSAPAHPAAEHDATLEDDEHPVGSRAAMIDEETRWPLRTGAVSQQP